MNRFALGYGVLCGLQVTRDGKFVEVDAGIAIDRYGREIIVPEPVRIDVSKLSADCRTTRDRRPDESPLFLWLCYRECKADFIPALVTDCASHQQCTPSSIVESYCLELRTKGPDSGPPDDALCKALNEGKTAAERRRLIDAALQHACPPVSGDGCIALAKIDIAAGGEVTAVDTTLQARVYGNDTLFELLLCLKRGGDQGPPGVGLTPDLPKILDIAWAHNRRYYYFNNPTALQPASFLEPFYNAGSLATADVLAQRMTDGKNPPLFTVYFNRPIAGIDEQTFGVRLQFELAIAQKQGVVRPGFFVELPLVGRILQGAGASAARTPNTHEAYALRGYIRAAAGGILTTCCRRFSSSCSRQAQAATTHP